MGLGTRHIRCSLFRADNRRAQKPERGGLAGKRRKTRFSRQGIVRALVRAESVARGGRMFCAALWLQLCALCDPSVNPIGAGARGVSSSMPRKYIGERKRMAGEGIGPAVHAGRGMPSLSRGMTILFTYGRGSLRYASGTSSTPMRNDYIQNAAEVIGDPYILVNVVSRRVKQLRRGYRPLITSLEKLAPEDIALREIAERKITYETATVEELETPAPPVRAPGIASAAPRRSSFGSHNRLVGSESRTA